MSNAVKNDHIATQLAEVFAEGAGSTTPPIVQSSLFTFESFENFEAVMAGQQQQDIYTRVQNPTVRSFETMMAKIESGEAAVGFASGMSAISSTLLALVKPGQRVACVEHVYPDAYRLFEQIMRPTGVEISYHSIEEFENNPDLLKDVDLAYLESPNSVMLQAMDLTKVAQHAKRNNTITVIDNSWATPVFQRPLELGIDVVVHSASKYISGHSDTVAGVVISSNEHIDKIRKLTLALLGGKLAPFEAWLLIRGLRTLNVRMQAHQVAANLFIKRLSALSQVQKINSPNPDSIPGLHGRSGLLSLEFTPDVDIRKFANSLKHFRLGVSWGGFESLILPASVALGQAGEQNSLQRFGVPTNLVRLSIGLEHIEDLWADFESALSKSIS